MNEPARKIETAPRPMNMPRVTELRCREPLHLGNDVQSAWSLGKSKSGSTAVASMELGPWGVMLRIEGRDKSRKLVLVPFSNVLSAELEE